KHSHRPAPAELFPPIFQDENITENNNEPNTPNISYEESSENPNESVEDENDEILELTPLEEFGQFLNVCVEISISEIEEITQIYEDEDKMLTSKVEDISHLAIDQNSK
ncbi:11308_t:CDS:1, partial [Gigaspora rosea]